MYKICCIMLFAIVCITVSICQADQDLSHDTLILTARKNFKNKIKNLVAIRPYFNVFNTGFFGSEYPCCKEHEVLNVYIERLCEKAKDTPCDGKENKLTENCNVEFKAFYSDVTATYRAALKAEVLGKSTSFARQLRCVLDEYVRDINNVLVQQSNSIESCNNDLIVNSETEHSRRNTRTKQTQKISDCHKKLELVCERIMPLKLRQKFDCKNVELEDIVRYILDVGEHEFKKIRTEARKNHRDLQAALDKDKKLPMLSADNAYDDASKNADGDEYNKEL